jgi:hypothetical protein
MDYGRLGKVARFPVRTGCFQAGLQLSLSENIGKGTAKKDRNNNKLAYLQSVTKANVTCRRQAFF